MSTKFKTEKVRLSYAQNMYEAKANDRGEMKFRVTLLIPKTDTVTIDRMKVAAEAVKRTKQPGKDEAFYKRHGRAPSMTATAPSRARAKPMVQSARGVGSLPYRPTRSPESSASFLVSIRPWTRPTAATTRRSASRHSGSVPAPTRCHVRPEQRAAAARARRTHRWSHLCGRRLRRGNRGLVLRNPNLVAANGGEP